MNLQSQFFENIKSLFKKETFSLVDDISEILHIERSTAYKRISGETPLKMDEIKILCNYYNVSFDYIIFKDTNAPIISIELIGLYKKGYQFNDFLNSIAKTFDSLRKGKENILIFLCNELSVLHLFGFPHLMYFVYIYCKSESEHFMFYDKAVSIPHLDKNEMEAIKSLCDEYCNHPSIEIISDTLLDYMINKIKFLSSINIIDKPFEDKLYEELRELCHYLENRCIIGKKVNKYNNIVKESTQFLYNPSSFHGQNEVYYYTDGYEKAFISNSISDYFSISDKNYCSFLKNKINRVKNISTNITIDNHLQRKTLFKHLLNKIP